MLGCYVHTAPDEISTSWKFVHKGVNRAKMWTPGAKIERFSYDLEMKTGKKKNRNKKRTEIDRFHSRGQHLCKFIGTKESVCIRKEFNSQRTGLGHQHGRRFIVLEHQYDRRDVMWKRSIERFDSFIKRIQTRVAFGWLSELSAVKTSRPRTF